MPEGAVPEGSVVVYLAVSVVVSLFIQPRMLFTVYPNGVLSGCLLVLPYVCLL